MRDAILRGEQPAAVFRALQSADPQLSNRELATRFYEDFPDVDSVAIQHIWYWKSAYRPGGVHDDEMLNEMLLDLLTEAGYKLKQK